MWEAATFGVDYTSCLECNSNYIESKEGCEYWNGMKLNNPTDLVWKGYKITSNMSVKDLVSNSNE